MLAQALPTGQLWLCFPTEENCTNIDPRRVQVTLLEPSWGPPGAASSWGSFWASRGLIWTIWALSVAQREIQQKHRILRCFWGCQGLPEGSEIAPKSAREASWTSLGTQDRSGGPKLKYIGPKLAPKVALAPAGSRRDSRDSCPPKSKSR